MPEPTSETHSYNVCLDRTEKAFEHRRIFPVRSLGISLPFRQAMLHDCSLVSYCDTVTLMARSPARDMSHPREKFN
jgi:hypothetical protein